MAVNVLKDEETTWSTKAVALMMQNRNIIDKIWDQSISYEELQATIIYNRKEKVNISGIFKERVKGTLIERTEVKLQMKSFWVI